MKTRNNYLINIIFSYKKYIKNPSVLYIFLLILLTLGYYSFSQIKTSTVYADGGDGACSDAQGKTSDSPGNTVTLQAPSGQVITSVCVKVTPHHFIITTDGQSNCYNVTGLNTNNVTVTRTGDGNGCQEISHIDYYYGILAPPPTLTPNPTSTPSPTLNEPSPTPTNSPSPTEAQPTPTPTIIDPTPTPIQPTSTPTPTGTLSSQTQTTPTPTPTNPTPTPTTELNITPTPTTTQNSSSNSTDSSGTGGTTSNDSSSSSTQNSTSSNTTSEGQVLGASTQRLPQTGPETVWLLLATLLSTTGFGSIISSTIIKNSKYKV